MQIIQATTPRLRALRRKRHLTLEQLAGTTGLNRGYLSRLEGKVEMRLADRSIGLSAGDYLQLPGHLSHQIRKVSKRASVLAVIGRD